MILKKIKSEKSQKVSKLIYDELSLGFNQIQKLIRNKDVKVDGKRISKDIEIFEGNIVEIYFNEKPIKIIFENKDIVIVFKTRNIETISENGIDDLQTKLSKQLGIELFAVHRLDRNTEGLIVFAKNKFAKDSLDKVIKERKIEKYYIAKVVGVPKNRQENLVAFLKKDENKARVYISEKKLDGYEIIKTNYKVIRNDENFSILEVELVTGKTHQIRAHLAHIGYPILGDEKYGDAEINKKNKKKYQCLCAYKLVFHFMPDDYLSNLNDVVIELDKNKIEF